MLSSHKPWTHAPGATHHRAALQKSSDSSTLAEHSPKSPWLPQHLAFPRGGGKRAICAQTVLSPGAGGVSDAARQGFVTSEVALTQVWGERSDARAPCNSSSSLLTSTTVSVCEISPDLNFLEFIQPSPWQFRAELFLCLAVQTPNWSRSDVYCFNSVIIWRLSSLQTRPVFKPGHILIWIKYQLCPLSTWPYRKTNWVKFQSKEWKYNWILASFEETQIIIIITMSLLITVERGQRCLFLCVSKNKLRHKSSRGTWGQPGGDFPLVLGEEEGAHPASAVLWSSVTPRAVILQWF